MINFLKGQPSADLLPTELFSTAVNQALTQPNANQDMLQYAFELGTPSFRNSLAAFLSKEYNSPVNAAHLCPTFGASMGLQHILSLLTRPNTVTKYCYFQEPTYFLAFDIFRDVGFELDQFVGIPDQHYQGMDMDYLENMLAAHFPSPPTIDTDDHDDNLIYNAVLYCVPTHANPTGSTLPPSQRHRLVQLARKYNVLVICDDVYDILTFSECANERVYAPKRLVAFDLELDGRPVVISNGSFSKILAPGARCGWFECSSRLIQRLGTSGSYISGGPQAFMNQVVYQMLAAADNPALCLHRHVAKVRQTLQERLHKGMWEKIQQWLVPLGCDAGPSVPQGGYFVWLQLPLGIFCDDVQRKIKEHGIEISFGNTNMFMVPQASQTGASPLGRQEEKFIRLCFAHYSVETLQVGIGRLAHAIELCLKQQQQLQSIEPDTWTFLPKGGRSSPNGYQEMVE